MADTSVGLHLDACGGGPAFAPDDELVSALREGAEAAYELLIVLYQQPVYSLVHRLMADPTDACDVVQEVFLKVFRNIRSFRANSSLKTWIYRIAVNEAHNHRRWFSRHQGQEVGIGNEDGTRTFENTFADPGRSPFELALDHEKRALIEASLAQLNPNFRAAVILRDIEDLSYEEIAVVLEVSLGTVKSRILRGREALRKILEVRLEPEPSMHLATQTVE